MRKLIAVECIAAVAFAASPADRFEVAAIHPTDPKTMIGVWEKSLPGGGISISGMTIRNLIWLAWRLPPERVSGGPGWLDSEHYDILAKPPAGGPALSGQRLMDEQNIRIQALLADRFQLKVHRETRSSPVYVLTVAKTGLRMHEANSADHYEFEKGTILPWEAFIADLSRRLGRPLVDKTGLKGVWFVKLSYSTDDGQAAGMGVRIDPAQPAAGPSIFTAVQEQLGLKLDSAKGPVDYLVIDSVSRPSAN